MLKSDKNSLTEQSRVFRTLQSVQLSTHDSGFVDEQAADSLTTGRPTSSMDQFDGNMNTDEHMTIDDILLTKSEEEEEDDDNQRSRVTHRSSEEREARRSNRQKWKSSSKRVSFQGQSE